MADRIAARIPARRALAESAIIVFSILFAFAVDAWWDDRQARRAEQVVLQGLLDEFEGNREELDYVQDLHRRIEENVLRLLRIAYGLEPPARDMARTLAYALASELRLDLRLGALNRYLTSDEPELVRNAELRTLLAGFLGIADEVWQQEQMVRDLVRGDITRHLVAHHDLLLVGTGSLSEALPEMRREVLGDGPETYVDDLFADPVIRNLMTARAGRQNVIVRKLERLRSEYDRIVALLSRELDVAARPGGAS